MTTATCEEPFPSLSDRRDSVQPKVSVIVPAFNVASDFLTASLESISTQSFPDFECLVIDESSDAELARQCQKACARDQRFHYIRPDQRLGLAGSLNLGLSMARGEFIARFDSDDICLTDRLKLQVEFLDLNPMIDIVGGAVEIIDDNDHTLAFRRYPESHDAIARGLHFTTPIAHPTVMMRRNVISGNCGYDPTFRFAEDLELWLRLLAHGAHFANLKEPLVKYRQSEVTRNRLHWKFNLRARLRNLGFRFIGYRMAGILSIAVWAYLPAWVQSRIVHWFILTRRQKAAA